MSGWSSPRPSGSRTVQGWAVRTRQREGAVLQLAHYWRSLESAGFAAPGAPTAALAGTDELADGTVGPLVWVDLDRPGAAARSPAGTGGRTRSALDRYDHEYGFRRTARRVARTRRGRPRDPAPLVARSISVSASVPVGGALRAADARPPERRAGWRAGCAGVAALARVGVDTVPALAGLDEAPCAGRHRRGGPDRAALAATGRRSPTSGAAPRAGWPTRCARPDAARRASTLRRRTRGPVPLRRGHIEVDLDIEWDTHDRVYLWGLLVIRPGQAAAYEAIVDWSPQPDDARLAGRVYRRLAELREQAREGGGRPGRVPLRQPGAGRLLRLLTPTPRRSP